MLLIEERKDIKIQKRLFFFIIIIMTGFRLSPVLDNGNGLC